MDRRSELHRAEVNVSLNLESHGIPDPYYFRFWGGKLRSFYSDEPVENEIIIYNQLGIVEYDGFQKIQEEVCIRDSGFILWISPPYDGVYDNSKIVISQIVIVGGEKQLLNHAIVTNWDKVGSVIIARELSQLSENPIDFKNTSEVRANPIIINKEREEELMAALQRIIDEEPFEMMINGTDFKKKDEYMQVILAGGSPSLGNKPISCPPWLRGKSPFQMFSGEKRILCCECPECHKQVEAEIYGGEIHCPKDNGGCGAVAPWKG